jgi:hypothetical protein
MFGWFIIISKLFTFLRYIYTGELNLEEYLGSRNILELLVASDELLLEELFEHVQDYLIKKQTTWVHENFDLVLHITFKMTRCKILQDYCLDSICADPLSFFTSNNFLLLNNNILYSLLQRNDLQIEEIVVWDSLIKWGISQTPGLGIRNSDRTKWNNENYEALKKTLNQLIPFIQFVEISPIEYFDKVRPYKAIIPNDIYEEIEEFYFKGTLPRATILSPRTGIIQKIESNIIKPKLSSIIVNWIERKGSNYKRNKKDATYNFNLIYRGSRDGINTDSCRSKCNLGEPLLVLVKCQNLRKIFGGFTPVGFYKRGKICIYSCNDYISYISSRDSFIFSFEENDDNQNMKISRVISFGKAIFNNFSSSFGFNFGGNLYMKNNNLYIGNSGNYEHNINCNKKNNNYMIEEIEAFRVVKK